MVARTARLLVGLWLFAAGLALMVRAGIGLSAWDVLHDAISSLTPLTFGQVVIVVSVVVLAASVALGIRPGVGTVANSVLIGMFTDALLHSPLLHDLGSQPFAAQLLVMLAGMWVIALGTALYIGANLGAGPRDALMLGIARRWGRSAGTARAAIEACVLVVGIVLGGTAGVGTVVFVILIGPALDVAFGLLGMNARRAETQSRALRRALRAVVVWGRRGELGSPPGTEASRHTGARI